MHENFIFFRNLWVIIQSEEEHCVSLTKLDLQFFSRRLQIWPPLFCDPVQHYIKNIFNGFSDGACAPIIFHKEKIFNMYLSQFRCQLSKVFVLPITPFCFPPISPWLLKRSINLISQVCDLSFCYLKSLAFERHNTAPSDFAERILRGNQHLLHEDLLKTRSLLCPELIQVFTFEDYCIWEHLAAKCELPLVHARVLSIDSRAYVISQHARWPIRTPRITCANQDAWVVITPKWLKANYIPTAERERDPEISFWRLYFPYYISPPHLFVFGYVPFWFGRGAAMAGGCT